MERGSGLDWLSCGWLRELWDRSGPGQLRLDGLMVREASIFSSLRVGNSQTRTDSSSWGWDLGHVSCLTVHAELGTAAESGIGSKQEQRPTSQERVWRSSITWCLAAQAVCEVLL